MNSFELPSIVNEVPYSFSNDLNVARTNVNALPSSDILQLLIQKKSEEVALLQEALEVSRRGEEKFVGESERLPPIFDPEGRVFTLPLPNKKRQRMETYVPSPFQSPQESPISSAASSPYMSPIRDPAPYSRRKMDKFALSEKTDFKHIVYNLLVDSYNYPNDPDCNFIQHYELEIDGVRRIGFRFTNEEISDKRLAEMYCYHAKKVNLENHGLESVLVQDLYKFYLRSCLELLAKYFEKSKEDRYTFWYSDDHVLFVPGGSLDQAAKRIRNMKTRARRNPEKGQRKQKQQRRR